MKMESLNLAVVWKLPVLFICRDNRWAVINFPDRGGITLVEIHVYGKLRRYVTQKRAGQDNVIRFSPEPDDTIASILEKVGIPVEEIYSIFLNAKLLAAKSGMARWIGYQQARTDIFDWNLKIPIKAGDRLGLFGRDMAALVV